MIFFIVIALSRQVTTEPQINIAVASNFSFTMKKISILFEIKTGNKPVIIPGSTAKHFAQIQNGAPYDAFFAADAMHPGLLSQQKKIKENSRFTYAIGRIVLWSLDEKLIDKSGSVLQKNNFRYLAIANPRLAPYGIAAQQLLVSLHRWNDLKEKLVYTENISQTYSLINSKNAELGIIAWSQLLQTDQTRKGSFWIVPQKYYKPIEQQAVILKDSQIIRNFFVFIKSKKIQTMIQKHGYTLP